MIIVIVLLAIGFVFFSFSFVLLFGAPFLPTLKQQVNEALNLLDLQPEQTMLELGCGDGRVMVAAAQRGLNVIGYELNPILAFVAWVRTRRYRNHTIVIWGDFWRASWPSADGIFGFILPRYMTKLHNKIIQYPYRPIRVASFAFTIPGEKPTRISKGIFLYEYHIQPT